MRQPRPFYRQYTGSWYVQLGRQQINLGKDEEEAFRRYHEMLARRGRSIERFKSVAEVLDAYLDWLHDHRAKRTYEKAQHYLSHFARYIGKTFPLHQLSGLQVTLWIENQKS
jgi:hypothetical protein